MERTTEQIQRAIASDLLVEGYYSWDFYDGDIYFAVKDEMEKRYDRKLSDFDFDKVIEWLEMLEDV